MKGHWNGKDCEAECGSVICGKSDKPKAWCRTLEGKRIECVRVTTERETFYLYDGPEIREVVEPGTQRYALLKMIRPDTFNGVDVIPSRQGSLKVFHTMGTAFDGGHCTIPVDDESSFARQGV